MKELDMLAAELKRAIRIVSLDPTSGRFDGTRSVIEGDTAISYETPCQYCRGKNLKDDSASLGYGEDPEPVVYSWRAGPLPEQGICKRCAIDVVAVLTAEEMKPPRSTGPAEQK